MYVCTYVAYQSDARYPTLKRVWRMYQERLLLLRITTHIYIHRYIHTYIHMLLLRITTHIYIHTYIHTYAAPMNHNTHIHTYIHRYAAPANHNTQPVKREQKTNANANVNVPGSKRDGAVCAVAVNHEGLRTGQECERVYLCMYSACILTSMLADGI